MKLVIIGAEDYYCIVKKEFCLEKVMEQLPDVLHMRADSFAYNYSVKIVRALFQNSINLCDVYNKYYAREYESFQIFLYQKQLLEYDEIEQLKIGENEILLRLRPTINGYNMNNILGYDGNGIQVFNQLLEDINI